MCSPQMGKGVLLVYNAQPGHRHALARNRRAEVAVQALPRKQLLRPCTRDRRRRGRVPGVVTAVRALRGGAPTAAGSVRIVVCAAGVAIAYVIVGPRQPRAFYRVAPRIMVWKQAPAGIVIVAVARYSCSRARCH